MWVLWIRALDFPDWSWEGVINVSVTKTYLRSKKNKLTKRCPNENSVSLGILSSHIGPPDSCGVDGTVRPGWGGSGGPVSEGWGCKTKGETSDAKENHRKARKRLEVVSKTLKIKTSGGLYHKTLSGFIQFCTVVSFIVCRCQSLPPQSNIFRLEPTREKPKMGLHSNGWLIFAHRY